jgi:hypothetical protein
VVSLSNEDWFFAGLFFYDMRDESGARAIMKMPLNAAGFTPRSAKIAPMATSTLIGSDFLRGGEGFLNCARRLHMNATHPGFTREFEQGAVRGSLLCNR